MFARTPQNLITDLPPVTPESARSVEQEIADANKALDRIEAFVHEHASSGEASPDFYDRVYTMLQDCSPVIECVGERLKAADPLWARAERWSSVRNAKVPTRRNDPWRTNDLEAVIQRYGKLIEGHYPEDDAAHSFTLEDPSTSETRLFFPFKSGAALRRDTFSYHDGQFTFLQRDETIDTLDDALEQRRNKLEPQIAEYKRMREKLHTLEDAQEKAYKAASA